MDRESVVQQLDEPRPAADLIRTRLGRAFKILMRVRRRLQVEEAARKHGHRVREGRGS